MSDESPTGPAAAGDNSQNRDEIIRECAAEFTTIKKARGKLNERAGKQRKRLRDCGVEPAAFALAQRINDLDDEVAQNNYMDSFQVSWASMEAGGQLDWIRALEDHSDDGAGDASTAIEPPASQPAA